MFEKYFDKYVIVIMVIFSIPSFIIFYNYYNISFWEHPTLILRIISVLNILCIILLLALNIKFIDKKSKYSIIIFTVMFFYFILTIIMNINFIFKFKLYMIFNILNIVNFMLYIMIGVIPIEVLKLANGIGYGIVAIIFTLFYSIIFTILFRIIRYKKNIIRNLIIILYYFLCNSCLVYLFYANRFIQSV
jgi:hypothetical protein